MRACIQTHTHMLNRFSGFLPPSGQERDTSTGDRWSWHLGLSLRMQADVNRKKGTQSQTVCVQNHFLFESPQMTTLEIPEQRLLFSKGALLVQLLSAFGFHIGL